MGDTIVLLWNGGKETFDSYYEAVERAKYYTCGESKPLDVAFIIISSNGVCQIQRIIWIIDDVWTNEKLM
jgi:hypothetical protein